MPDHESGQPACVDFVIVLSYFGRADTLACVESLVNGSPEARILVIDNGTFDGVIEAVTHRWPQVETLQTGTNLGFAGGMNRGIRWALDQGAETVTILNNDTLVSPGAITALSGVARTGVAVSPEVRYADRSERVWFGGGTLDPLTQLPRHLSEAEILGIDGPVVPELRPSQVLAGCCVTASAETWRRVGLFDERYFLNFEDSDWSLRASANGVALVVATGVVIHHKVSASFTGAYSYLGLFYYARNGLLFGSSHRPGAFGTRVQFVRRHVLPVLGEDGRQRQVVMALRHLLVITWALSAHLLRKYGRAPRALEGLTRRWAG